MRCPECGSTKTRKQGFATRARRPVQRYLCLNCRRLFMEPRKDAVRK